MLQLDFDLEMELPHTIVSPPPQRTSPEAPDGRLDLSRWNGLSSMRLPHAELSPHRAARTAWRLSQTPLTTAATVAHTPVEPEPAKAGFSTEAELRSELGALRFGELRRRVRRAPHPSRTCRL